MKKLFGILMILLLLGCSISEDSADSDPPQQITVVEVDNGLEVTIWKDYNGDDIINEDEIISIDYIYNGDTGADGQDGNNGADGTDGSNGSDGTDGIDGISVGIRVDLYKGDDCEYGGYDIVTWSYITATGEVIEGTEKHNIICA